ncbi:glycerol-3-phosphate dehydrogenase/oxidase [Metabacillus herbersteinensis]|uniref:Glycerol-3-phosphate dehydrogenase n=1 Tax=Metabacillus herbersteinensis TaxID=283816 RepID=A0ABV6GG65_9BACI
MSQYFSSQSRGELLTKMEQEQYDVFVIGGGITGAGIALDAASRGMKIGLVEMQDFAAGTSSRSTKLVHGGLRYLKQFEVKMVAEVGRERAVVYENGPHVTTPEWMLLPIHKGGTFGKFSTSVGLRAYDFLANVKGSERRKMFSAKDTLAKVPLLKQEGLLGGGYYVEYRTDDARLTIEVMKESVKFGADVLNYAKVDGFIYEKGKIIGVKLTDCLTNKVYSIFAKKIVNATGPWVDELREQDNSKKGKSLHLTKGIHLVFDQSKFPLKQAIYFDTPDERMVFAIPRDGKAYVGTTDTVYKQDIKNPRMTVEDRDYVLKSISYMFPNLEIAVEDVESSWSGLRPLIHEDGKGPSEISRKDEIWTSDSGLITIAGGKLTGYRKMAEQIVNTVTKRLHEEENKSYGPCVTKNMPISGGHVGGASKFPVFVKQKTEEGKQIGLTSEQAHDLASRYGSNVDKIFDIVVHLNDLARDIKVPVTLLAEVQYSITEEMATTPSDFFVRRTGAVYFNINWAKQWKDSVTDFMSSELNWTVDQKKRYLMELEQHIHAAEVPMEV